MEIVGNKRIVYEFGRFVLDPNERTLFLDGVPLHLPAKEFETLLLLVENNGRALSKEQLISAVWQDSFVEEGNLAKQISRLRKILNAEDGVKIETLPKHGYRFSADVKQITQPIGETILQKRTVNRLTVEFEEERNDRAAAACGEEKNTYCGNTWSRLDLVDSLRGLVLERRELCSEDRLDGGPAAAAANHG